MPLAPDGVPLELPQEGLLPQQARRAATQSLSSLRKLALLSVLLPLLAYVAVGVYRYQEIRAETVLRLDRALRIAHEHALRILDTNETLLARMQDLVGSADAATVVAGEALLHNQLAAMSRNKQQILSLWVIGADGRPLASDRYSPVPADLDMSQRMYFKWHQRNGGSTTVSPPTVNGLSSERFIDIARARRGPDGSFLGVLKVSLRTGYFERFHGDLGADEPGLAITMLSDDGAVLSRWPLLATAPPRLSPNSPVMTRIRAGETAGDASGVSSLDGRKRLLMFRKVGDYPVYVGTGMDVGEIRKRWLIEMAWLAGFGLPPLLGLYFAARVALRRTRESVQAAERLNDESAARRRVEEALLQAQKLEALGRLTGGVAHDFNNALMVISNNLVLIKLKHPDVGSAQLESIGRAVGSATKLTRQLLAFSRRQALVPERIGLTERLPAMQDLIHPVLGARVQLSLEVEPETAPIRVDLAEFELALINLAINARDAMPGGGTFSVRARNASAVELPPLQQGPMVLVEARDSGAGIPADVIAKVFEPFFTTKPVGQGTGLGLSQVYGLCQRAGGTATVESEPGLGTVVRLFFPMATGAAPAAKDAAPALQRNLDKRVLMVEDNDEVALALQQVLEAMGCSVTRLDRAGAGLDWLAVQERQGRLPDLVLSDVVMPGGMDGLDLAHRIRAQYPALRVILMTGYAEQLDAISRAGFEVLPKPCSAQMLAAALGRE